VRFLSKGGKRRSNIGADITGINAKTEANVGIDEGFGKAGGSERFCRGPGKAKTAQTLTLTLGSLFECGEEQDEGRFCWYGGGVGRKVWRYLRKSERAGVF